MAFDLLKEQEELIKSEFGLPIEWERLDARRTCRIAIYRQNAQVTDPPEELAELRKWAVDTMLKFRGALNSRIRELKLDRS